MNAYFNKLFIIFRKSGGFELQPVAVGCRAPHTIGYLESYFEGRISDNYQTLNPRLRPWWVGGGLFNRSIFPTMNQLPSCDRNSFQFPANRENGTGRILIPSINLTGFYVSDYLPKFDQNKDRKSRNSVSLNLPRMQLIDSRQGLYGISDHGNKGRK